MSHSPGPTFARTATVLGCRNSTSELSFCNATRYLHEAEAARDIPAAISLAPYFPVQAEGAMWSILLALNAGIAVISARMTRAALHIWVIVFTEEGIYNSQTLGCLFDHGKHAW